MFVHSLITKELEDKMNKWVVLYDNTANRSRSITVPKIQEYDLIKVSGMFHQTNTDPFKIRDWGEFTRSALQAGVMVGAEESLVGTSPTNNPIITLSGENMTAAYIKYSSSISYTRYVTQVLGMKL